jgi:hypothetical protein
MTSEPLSIDVIEAHRHASFHRYEILESQTCGCFYCLAVFLPQFIQDWIHKQDDLGQTALCPTCGVDSVIGSKSGYPLTPAFLQKMRQHWFG